VRGLLPASHLAAGSARGTTKETGDRYRPLLRIHCEKFARGRCVSADLRNHQELKGIRAEKPLRERSVITSHAVGVWRLFDRNSLQASVPQHNRRGTKEETPSSQESPARLSLHPKLPHPSSSTVADTIYRLMSVDRISGSLGFAKRTSTDTVRRRFRGTAKLGLAILRNI